MIPIIFELIMNIAQYIYSNSNLSSYMKLGNFNFTKIFFEFYSESFPLTVSKVYRFNKQRNCKSVFYILVKISCSYKIMLKVWVSITIHCRTVQHYRSTYICTIWCYTPDLAILLI